MENREIAKYDEIIRKNLGRNIKKQILLSNNEREIEYSNGEVEIYKIIDMTVENSANDLFNKLDDIKTFFAEKEGKKYDNNYIFIFQDLSHQLKYINGKAIPMRWKKQVREFVFDESLVLYSNVRDVNLGIRKEDFLIQYKPISSRENSLVGRILNVEFKSLYELYNLTGKHTFKYNVRNGLKGNNSLPIYNNFYATIFEEIKKKLLEEVKSIVTSEWEEQKNKFEKTLNLNPNIDAKNFWFHHNGLSIVYEDDLQFETADTIKINPAKFKIINGAQTTTNLFRIFFEKEKIMNNINEILNDEECQEIYKMLKPNILDDIIDSVKKDIVLKTTLITMKDDNQVLIESITRGLNTQIPIDISSLISQELQNQINKKYTVRLTKPGEIEKGNNMLPLSFAKNYLTFVGQPGVARNFRKSELESKLKEINENNVDEHTKNSFLAFVNNTDVLEESFKTYKKRETEDTKVESLKSNGLYYFKSFVCKYYLNDIEEMFDEESVFNEFEAAFKSTELYKGTINSNDFKTDTLWEEMKRYMENKVEPSRINNAIVNTKLDQETIKILKTEELKLHGKSSYSIAIKRMIDQGILSSQLLPFRTIRTIKKDQRYKMFEAFALPRDTFMEFSLMFDEDGEMNENFTFKNSEFYKSLQYKMNYLLLSFDEKNNLSEVFVRNLEFEVIEKLIENAEKFFDKIVENFTNGDSKFSQIDSDFFHIRPKAKNSDDTFIFTNGEEVVKSTIWINKNKMEEIVNEMINSTN